MTAMSCSSAIYLLLFLTVSLKAEAQPKTLDVYLIDVEGGDATLFVSPSGQSMLFDTGWPGFNGRDADRIAAAARDAGLKQIDYLVTTHFHVDHFGGAIDLAARLPVRHYLDHGTTTQKDGRDRAMFQSYAELRAKGHYTEVKSGDRIPISGLDVRVIASAGKVLRTPLPGGGGLNPYCAGFRRQEGVAIEQEKTFRAEDPQSVSAFITLGKFRIVNAKTVRKPGNTRTV
jgi:competence protein ComEC